MRCERPPLFLAEGGRVDLLDHVRAPLDGSLDRPIAPPTGHGAVVARRQNFGNLAPPPHCRPGVDRVFQQPGRAMGLLEEGLGVADHAGKQAPDRLDEGDGRDLAAVEHVVSQRVLENTHAGPLGVLARHPRVDPLVSSAGHDDALGARELLARALRQRLPSGSGDGEDDVAFSGRRVGADDLVEGLSPHVGPHHHSCAAAGRGVVDRSVRVVRPVAKIMGDDVEDSPLLGLSQQ